MRIFRNFSEAHAEIKRDLFEMGTLVKTDTVQDIQINGNPDYDTKEIMPYIYRVENMGDMIEVADRNGCNLAWVASEFAERIFPDYINPGEAWKHRREMWEPFLKRNMGKFAYCVISGSRVLTKEGMRCIEELKEGDLVYDMGGNLVPIKTFIKLKKRKVIRIKTQYGFELVGTLNHPLLGIQRRVHTRHTTNKKAYWITLEDFCLGDYVSIFTKYPEELSLNSSLAFLIGLVMADGSVGSGRVCFTNKNKKLSDLFVKLCDQLKLSNNQVYNKAGFWFNYIHKESSRTFLHSYNLFLENYAFVTRETNLSFLGGFCEGDGYLDKERRKIVFCSSSKHPEQCEIIKTLLLKLGILPYHKQYQGKLGEGSINISVNGNQAEKLLPLLPLKIKEKPIWKSRKNTYCGKGRFLSSQGFLMDRIIEKTEEGLADVYDIETEGNFICNGIVSHNTYNERYRRQLKLVIEELKKHPTSRQAFMNMFLGPEDLPKAGVDRVPCSLGYHFIVREGKLFMVYFMRSSDFYSHFIYDVVLSRMLQDHVAESTGITSGPFIHYITSLHIFRKDFKTENIF